MIKGLFLAAVMAASVVPAGLPSNIRVLIMDGVFQGIPSEGEKLGMLGKVSGRLLLSSANYTGKIEVWRGDKGLYLINELPMEEYVRNVVKAEIGSEWDVEAMKAQAVIVRTYAIKRMLENGTGKFHLTSSVLHQVYKGETNDQKVLYAVRATEGQVLTYGGKPIEALYHSTCGGRTENSEDVFSFKVPYLKSLAAGCDLSPYNVWARSIPLEEIGEAFGLKGVTALRVKSYTSTGRVKELEMEAQSGGLVVKSNDFRKTIGWKRVPSTDFSLKVEDGEALLEGRGYGHGVGLCQWSALQMAKEGKTYKEILSFYYPDTVLKAYEGR